MNSSKHNKSAFALIGLALLLLLSPCKVRHFIQAELGVAQTEVSSKSQTSLTTAVCENSKVSESAVLSVELDAKELAFPVVYTTTDYPEIEFNQEQTLFNTSRNHRVSTIPLYILYHNFKVYL